MSSGIGVDPFSSGINLAYERLLRYGVELPGLEQQVRRELAMAQSLIDPLQTPPRAIELFTENVTIAGAMRIRYNEPPLTIDEMRDYLTACRHFLNSFWHL